MWFSHVCMYVCTDICIRVDYAQGHTCTHTCIHTYTALVCKCRGGGEEGLRNEIVYWIYFRIYTESELSIVQAPCGQMHIVKIGTPMVNTCWLYVV
jgi:hypothetical protein